MPAPVTRLSALYRFCLHTTNLSLHKLNLTHKQQGSLAPLNRGRATSWSFALAATFYTNPSSWLDVCLLISSSPGTSWRQWILFASLEVSNLNYKSASQTCGRRKVTDLCTWTNSSMAYTGRAWIPFTPDGKTLVPRMDWRRQLSTGLRRRYW